MYSCMALFCHGFFPQGEWCSSSRYVLFLWFHMLHVSVCLKKCVLPYACWGLLYSHSIGRLRNFCVQVNDMFLIGLESSGGFLK